MHTQQTKSTSYRTKGSRTRGDKCLQLYNLYKPHEVLVKKDKTADEVEFERNKNECTFKPQSFALKSEPFKPVKKVRQVMKSQEMPKKKEEHSILENQPEQEKPSNQFKRLKEQPEVQFSIIKFKSSDGVKGKPGSTIEPAAGGFEREHQSPNLKPYLETTSDYEPDLVDITISPNKRIN